MIRSSVAFPIVLLALGLVSACVRPKAAEAPVVPPVAAAPPPPPAAAQAWTDGPVTPGAWRYRADADGSAATFGDAGGAALFALRCLAGDVAIAQPGARRIDVTTTTLSRSFAPGPDGAAHVPPRDAFLDAMAFSRGRILVGAPPQPVLVIPAQAEIGRVVEDCRG